MRPKTLLYLTVAALVLGAFIFFYEKDLPSTEERAELAKKVLRLEDDEIEALLIETGGQAIRLERQHPPGGDDGSADGADGGVSPAAPDGGWRIVSPLAARADRVAVDALLSLLTGLEASRAFEDFDRGELGLDEPRARVTVIADSGQSVLEIGAELPASNDMVVAVAGGTRAYQVASTLFDDLTRAPGDWRDKKLFPGVRADVDRVTLEAGGERVLLAKRGDDFWIESPLTDRADEEQVNALLSELTGLRIETFLDEPLLSAEAMGLEPSPSLLEVVLGGRQQPFRLELGAATGDEDVFYGRADAQLFEIKTRLPESFVAAGDWRSKSWTALQVFKIEAARFEDAEGVVEIRRDGADWKRGEDRIGYTTVSDLLYAITEARSEQVLEREAAIAAGHDLGQASLAITLSTREGDEQLPAEELSLFSPVDGFAAASSGDRDAVLLFAEETAGEIIDQLRQLRAAEPLADPDAEDEKTPESE